MKYLVLILCASQAGACSFAASGLAMPEDEIHTRGLPAAGGPGFIPGRLSTEGNPFVTSSLLKPPVVTGGARLLADELLDFASTQAEDMCYWSFQPLAPPLGDGPKYWDVSRYDEDLEWQAALANSASARLQKIQKESDGILVGSMCADGRDIAQRRCDTGRAQTDSWTDSCNPVTTSQELRWGMAITIWKVDPKMKDWLRHWRSNASFGHVANIQWTYRGGSQPTLPYDGGAPVPSPTEIDPPAQPHGPIVWPSSVAPGWGGGAGSSMLGKVLPCSQVPPKFRYSDEQFNCDHVSQGANTTTADEAYASWRAVNSMWPPTKSCADDIGAVNVIMKSAGLPEAANCSKAMAGLQAAFANFDCDVIMHHPREFKDLCCSVCGNRRIPDVKVRPAPAPPPAGKQYRCGLCGHRYDAEEDAAGVSFQDLPDTWTCPICGMPKATFKLATAGEPEALMV